MSDQARDIVDRLRRSSRCMTAEDIVRDRVDAECEIITLRRRVAELEEFVEGVRCVLESDDWHPDEWHRFLRRSIPAPAAEAAAKGGE